MKIPHKKNRAQTVPPKYGGAPMVSDPGGQGPGVTPIPPGVQEYVRSMCKKESRKKGKRY